MAKSNRQRVDDVLILVGKGLRPFVEAELSKMFPGDWTEQVASRGNWAIEKAGTKPNPDDEDFLCWVIINFWQNPFRKVLGQVERGYITEIRQARGKFAHREGFTIDATARVCDTAYLLLSAIGAPEASEVDEIRSEVQRQRYEERKPAAAQTLPGMNIGTAGGLKPWRDVIEPHEDVATGRYQQAEFAADLAQVQRGGGLPEYRDPSEFFRRTFLTKGLRDLLVQTVRRVSGEGGEPVIDLLTNFGGGKTHSLLAVYHLCDSTVAPGTLPGIEGLLHEAGVSTFPKSITRAVMVGTALSPHRVVNKPDGCQVRTLWGEMAWQLGGKKAYELVREQDQGRADPGSDLLVELFELCGPAVILIDEWVAYARQLWSRDDLHGGTFDVQMSFAQSLAEAVKAVPNVMLLVSIPASDRFREDGSDEKGADTDPGIEVGGQGGLEALKRLRNVIHRSDSPWQPATAEEGFEIVRRRLFKDLGAQGFADRDATARALVTMYQSQPSEFPTDSRDPIYEDRIRRAYPIHPELFDRLYQDWAALERFQRTRGVLRLMAAVVHSLWVNGDQRPIVLPSSLPLDDKDVFEEVTRHLEDNWKPVVDADVDGPASTPAGLDRENQAFGRHAAARRVSRTVFMGSAPTLQRRVGPDGSAVQNPNRGVEDIRVKLGCVLPGETAAVFGDALRRLTDLSTHLYVDGSRYWFSTTASVARIAQDLADSFKVDRVHAELVDWVRKETDRGCFARVHRMPTGPADVEDEPSVGLIVLRPEHPHNNKIDQSPAVRHALEILDKRQGGTRTHKNMLVFLAADSARLEELETAIRQHMAWKSISDRRNELNLDQFGITQTETKLKQASETIKQRITETYIWLICPEQSLAEREVRMPAVKLDSQGTLAERATKKAERDTSVITTYGASNLRLELDRIPLWRGDHVSVRQVWDDFTGHYYLPRLRDLSVLLGAVADGPRSLDISKDGFAYADSYDAAEGRYRGLVVHAGVTAAVADGSSVLIRPEAAIRQIGETEAENPRKDPKTIDDHDASGGPENGIGNKPQLPEAKSRPQHYFGRKVLNASRVGLNASEIANEIVANLSVLPGVSVEVVMEIRANGPGFDSTTVALVIENGTALRLDVNEFD